MSLRGRVGARRRKLLLVTGGSGFLGRHLTHGRASEHWELIAPSSTSMDIRRRDSTIAAITDWKPTAVVHLAYRKGDRPSIVDGSRHVAEAAAACGARLVHMSTDVIFPGRPAPYTESDVPFPIIDYGRDKLDAERAVVEACPDALLLRTSLLYGTDELGVPQLDVQRALAGTTPMTFFTDEFRCPAHVDDIADAVAHLAGRPDITGVLHVAGPEALSRADFARRTARWLGLDPAALHTGTIESAVQAMSLPVTGAPADSSRSGGLRVARVVLDSSRANALGIGCRSVDEAYGRR